jgi:hypothetical protein
VPLPFVLTGAVVRQIDTVPQDKDDIVQRMHQEGTKTMKLKLGFIAVRNRTPRELEEGISLEVVRQRERHSFDSHPLLRKIDKQLVGTDKLAAKIVELQGRALQGWFPKTARRLREEVKRVEAELATLATPCELPNECLIEVSHILNRMHADLERLIGGRSGEDEVNVSCDAFEAMEALSEGLQEDTPDFFSLEMTERIEDARRADKGVMLPNLTSSPVVQRIARDFLSESLPERTRELMQSLFDTMASAVLPLIEKHAASFPRLANALQGEMMELLGERRERCEEVLGLLIKSELAFINTLNHYYMDTFNKAKEKVLEAKRGFEAGTTNAQNSQPSTVADFRVQELIDLGQRLVGQSNEAQVVLDLQLSLASYSKVSWCLTLGRSVSQRPPAQEVTDEGQPQVVRKAFVDSASKLARFLLIECFQDSFVETVVKRLTHQGSDLQHLVMLMQEDPDVAARRARLRTRLERFQQHLPKIQAEC